MLEPRCVEPQPPIPVPPPSPVSIFSWDSKFCSTKIVLSEKNNCAFLNEEGYCFRTVLGSESFMGGTHYWVVQADSRTENELKVGVTSRKNFNLDTAFCDFDYGWGFYGLGQLRHGDAGCGMKYGKGFKKTGHLGVYLDMNKGQLSFALNGKFLGIAFRDPALKVGPIIPAVSLLHKAGCKLVTGISLPSYFLTQ